jgi:signal transduction histidine kinase
VQYQIELEKQNESLNRKNGKLSEYVRMNSHDVRGPLSNILSLIELEKHETMNHSEFVNHVKESADKLDSTLRRINEVLLIED